MLSTRVIPSLLLKGVGLVKGQNFKNHKYVGDPINAVRIFNEKEVDELFFLDITASQENKEPNFKLLEDIATEAFMPLGYGGGITNLSQIERLFKIGFEKVIINTACQLNPSLITQAAAVAGSQSIVAAIDIKKTLFRSKSVFIKSGTINIKQSPVAYAQKLEALGVGEIILTSIDHEGQGKGYDYELVKQISHSVNIPVVISGGAGQLDDFKKAVDSGASAVAAGDMFTFYGKHRAVLITYPEYEQLTNLFKGS